MTSSIIVMCLGVTLLQVGFWVMESAWVSFIGLVLMFYSAHWIVLEKEK